ncbi:Thioesterase domain-containing protein [Streptomyces sp. yr375]|nr:Thioesterase domain-containing protein [Streptomyces sp. yr375]
MRTAGTTPATWIRPLTQTPMTPMNGPRTRLRLFCFPYAGGGTWAYRGWAEHLPDGVELHAIALPGRETRIAERPVADLPTLLADLVPALRPYVDAPFAFFGHSMGAVLAWETARAVQADRGRSPEHIFVSGSPPPSLVSTGVQDLPTLPDAELVERIGKLNGSPGEVLANAELMELLLPAFRADFTLLANYTPAPDAPPPACPVTVFGGDHDPRAEPNSLGGWAEFTRDPPEVHVLPGDHFFLHSARAQLLARVSARL